MNLLKHFGEKVNVTDAPLIQDQNPDDFDDYRPEPVPEKQEAEPLRLINNALEFLNDVVEEVSEWVERELGEGTQPAEQKTKPLVLNVFNKPGTTLGFRRYTLAADGMPVAFARDNRTELELVNWGPDPVYLAHEPIPPFAATAVPPNVRLVPVSSAGVLYAPVRLIARDEVWARTATTNTATLEVTDTYGCE